MFSLLLYFDIVVYGKLNMDNFNIHWNALPVFFMASFSLIFIFIFFANISKSPCLYLGKRYFCLDQFPIYDAQCGMVTDI